MPGYRLLHLEVALKLTTVSKAFVRWAILGSNQ